MIERRGNVVIERHQMKLCVENEKTPLIYITYKTRKKKTRTELVNDKIGFWINGGDRGGARYRGNLPVVFIRRDKMNDLDLLNLANLIFIESREAKTETELIRIVEDFTKNSDFKFRSPLRHTVKPTYRDEDYHLKFPEYNFVAIGKTTFAETVRKIRIDETQEKIKKQ